MNVRFLNLALFGFTAACLFMGYFLQYTAGLIPCPLCIMQRGAMMLIALTSVIAFFWQAIVRRLVYWVLQSIGVMAGLFFALRQLWIQAQPLGESPTCMPGLDILVQYFPVTDLLRALFWGGGECAKASYSWFGLSLATWSLFYFCCAALVLVLIFIGRRGSWGERRIS